MAGKLDSAERLTLIDAISAIARQRRTLRYLTNGLEAGVPEESPFPKPLRHTMVRMIDWDTVLRTFNRPYDRMIASARLPDPARRRAVLATHHAEMARLRERAVDVKRFTLSFFAGQMRETVSKQAGEVFACILMPPAKRLLEAEDRCRARSDLALLSLGLRAYKTDHDEYPEQLGKLVPKYFDAVPKDPFTGKALEYRRDGKGYLLYSLGANGTDDDGRGLVMGPGPEHDEEAPEADDIVIRMPTKRR
jgi:hypothetical protein